MASQLFFSSLYVISNPWTETVTVDKKISKKIIEKNILQEWS